MEDRDLDGKEVRIELYFDQPFPFELTNYDKVFLFERDDDNSNVYRLSKLID